MHIYGSGYGDAEPPEDEEIDFEILTIFQEKWPALAKLMSEAEYQDLVDEALSYVRPH